MNKMPSKKEFCSFLKVAKQIAVEAGDLLQSRFGRKQKIRHKGTIDIVTEMDLRSQALILRRLRDEFPEHDMVSEEGALTAGRSEFRWIIDPLDGTTNYAHGFPVYCVSIALAFQDAVIIGAVYCPTRQELFTGKLGGGAFLNGRKIRVSSVDCLDRALLATGFPYDIRTSPDNNLAHFERFARRAQAVRRAGAAALDLCYVGAGRFDGFWEIKLKCWDVAAGMLIVTEAGGVATNFSGGPIDLAHPRVLASNGHIHKEMIKILR